jgi:hypothetical protein
MEKSPEQKKEKISWWHDAIQEERKIGYDHVNYFEIPLNKFVPLEKRDNALVLGDASQLVTESLVKKHGFKHATVVDGDPLVLDEYKLKNDDEHFTKIKSNFSDYIPPENTFNFIYGKSIAFTPKEDLSNLLNNLYSSLASEGFFIAVCGAEGDTFRKEHYTKEELDELYKKAGFKVLFIKESSKEVTGLTEPGLVHDIKIAAKK